LRINFIWLLTPLLIMVEQGIKILIYRCYFCLETPLLPPWIYFRPVFNRDYSWLNSLFQLGLGRLCHIVVVFIITIALCLLYYYLKRQQITSGLLDFNFSLLFAGAICSLLDKIFWDGSLDYILLKGFFTFDLKDVFINGSLGLFLLMFTFDHEGLRTRL